MRTKCTCRTFSFSPENEGPKGGDYLKLVVAVSSHLSDGAGQDHTFGVHLLNTDTHEKQIKHTLNQGYKQKQTHAQLHT